MSATTRAEVGRHDPSTHDTTRMVAAFATGAAFVAEAAVSLLVDSHVGYHALNTVLNAALLVVAVSVARQGRARVGVAGVVGGWGTAVMALLAACGGLWALGVEGLTAAETPGVVDGITHTAVLASILFMVPLGVGLRRTSPVPGTVVALASACLVAMVLAGLDSPAAFLAPEAVLGAGWLLYGRSMRTETEAIQRR